jgi:hypothetical protein
MKRLVLFLLGISLGANAWILWGRARTDPTTATATIARSTSAPIAATPPSAASLPIAGIESADAATVAAALREAGADDATLRAMLEGILRRRHREKLAAVRIERERNAWWRNGRTAQEGDATLSKEMVAEPLADVLGRDPLELAALESRYAFLPPATRRKLAEIDLDYTDLLGSGFVSALTAQLRVEASEQKLLAEEKRKDVLAALTPGEKAEYDLRFSSTAGSIGQRAALMNATEAEYRAIKPVLDDFDAKSRALPRGESYIEAYEDLQRAAARQLAGAVGYDRAVEYLWSGYTNSYGPMRRAADEGRIPAEAPVQVMELKVETGRRAAEVHGDAALTLDQKRGEFAALRRTAQAQLDALLPGEAQRALPPEALRWLSELEEGRYSIPQPSLLSSGVNHAGMLTSTRPSKWNDMPSMPPRPAVK